MTIYKFLSLIFNKLREREREYIKPIEDSINHIKPSNGKVKYLIRSEDVSIASLASYGMHLQTAHI